MGDTKGNTWIIETKGGEDAYGNSKNIDIKIENKYESLKAYAEKYSVDINYLDQQQSYGSVDIGADILKAFYEDSGSDDHQYVGNLSNIYKNL